jgi:predicted RNA-binding protein YlxR (DUF448 family)
MCIGCRRRRKKEEMVRFIQSAEGVIFINEMKNPTGRGIYLCPDLQCLKMAQKKKQMVRVFGLDGTPLSLETRPPQWMKGLA